MAEELPEGLRDSQADLLGEEGEEQIAILVVRCRGEDEVAGGEESPTRRQEGGKIFP